MKFAGFGFPCWRKLTKLDELLVLYSQNAQGNQTVAEIGEGPSNGHGNQTVAKAGVTVHDESEKREAETDLGTFRLMCRINNRSCGSSIGSRGLRKVGHARVELVSSL